jgi:hypothetical protein
MYFSSGVSKLIESGPGWVGAGHLRALILSKSPFGLDSPINDALLGHTWLSATFAGVTLVIELGAVAVVVGPRTRMAIGALLAAMHCGMYVCGGLFAMPTVVLSWPLFVRDGLAELRDGTPDEPVWDPGRMSRALLRVAAIGTAVVALAWAVPFKRALQTEPFHQRLTRPMDPLQKGERNGPGHSGDR